MFRMRFFKYIFLLSLALSSYRLLAQSHQIDSLSQVISKCDGIDKYEPLISLLRIYWKVDNSQECLKLAKIANDIAYRFGDSSKIVQSSRIIGQVFNKLTKYDEAERNLLAALAIAKRNDAFKSEQIKILTHLANAYLFEAKYDKALDLNFQALSFLGEDQSYDALTIIHNLGVVYYKLKDYNKGLLYFSRALKIRKELSDHDDKGLLLANISLCYAYTNKFTMAKMYVDSVSMFCKINKCSDVTLTNANFCLGVIHFGQKQLNEAETFFLRSYYLAKNARNDRFMLDNIDYLLQIYIQNNEINKAKAYVKIAEGLIAQSEYLNLEVIKIYSRFFQLYDQIGHFERAAFYQQKYVHLKDSIYTEELITNLMKIQADYLERENTARIASQNQILQLNQDVIEKQNLINIFIGCMAAMLVLLAGVLIRSNRQKQKINLMLDEKVKERTKQYEESHEAIMRANEERNILIQRASGNMKGLIATIRGLCSIGLHDIVESKAKVCITKIVVTSDDLDANLQSFQKLAISLQSICNSRA